MRKPRVFISHSSKDGDASSILRDALADALRATGYPVLLDKDELELGENWRNVLNMWMRGCDAAIVLLSEKALASRFVAYEASVLTYRNDVDNRFLLIPVFLDPVGNQSVQESPLAPTRIHDVQTIIRDVSQQTVIQEVLNKLSNHPAQTGMHHHTEHLMVLLGDVPDPFMEKAAGVLKIDLGGWMPSMELKMRLVMKMMGVGLERDTVMALTHLDPHLLDPSIKTAGQIIDLVGSAWVDNRSVAVLPKAVQEQQAVGINGINPLTAIMYVIQASPHPPGNRFQWKVVQVDGVSGEIHGNRPDVVIDQVRKALTVELLAGLDEDEEEEMLKENLEMLQEWNVHVFVVLPAVTQDVLQALHNAYPEVTFFLLMGEERPEEDALKSAGVIYLEPDLADGQEKYYCTLYHNSRKFLMNPILQ